MASLLAVGAMVASGLTFATATLTAAPAQAGVTAAAGNAQPAKLISPRMAPGNPGVPGDPTVLFEEDFENRAPNSNVSLIDYTGASGMTYSADSYWASPANCNGFIINQTSPRIVGDCAPEGVSEASGINSYNNLAAIPYALGMFADSATPAENAAASSYTAGDNTDNEIQFRTESPLTLSTEDRFVTFSVDAAATNCFASHPELRFYLENAAGVEIPVSTTAIDPCVDPRSTTVDAPRGNGTPLGVTGGRFAADSSVLLTGNTLGVVMRNENGLSNGNDGAYDNIRVLDVTPQLDKSFSPAEIYAGQTTTLTFTVTNTSELAAKNGWSFADELPDGLVVAPTPNAATTCPAGVVTATAGESTMSATGNLSAGMTSCEISVDLTASEVGTYTNGPDNVTESGLNPPADTTLIVTDAPEWTCSAFGYLFQTPAEDVHQIIQVDLVSGAYEEIATTDGSVNAVGYNTLDNFVYGWDQTASTLVRIAPDGSLIDLGHPDGATVTYQVGDFDDQGHLFLQYGGNGTLEWVEIDLEPGSATYAEVVNSGTAIKPAGVAAMPSDWVFVGGAFYGIANTTAGAGLSHLVSFDPETGATTDLGTVANTVFNATYGAGYADAGGNLYFSDNASGQILRVDPTTRESIVVSAGPSSGGNDGARCATAPIPTLTVTKVVEGRVAPADQFTVGLNNDAGAVLTSVTTVDTQDSASTTNWPVSQGATYTITDAMAAGSSSSLDRYVATIVCTDTETGEAVAADGDVGAWAVTVSSAAEIECVVTNSALELEIEKTSNMTADSRPGDTVEYTVTATNTGAGDYTDAVPAVVFDDLAGVLDDAEYNSDAVAVTSDGSDVSVPAFLAPSFVSWSGPLAAGESVTITYSVTLAGGGDGTVRNVAWQPATPPPPGTPPTDVPTCNPATADGTDPVTGEACAATENLLPKLTVDKTSDVTDLPSTGGEVTYTVTVTNEGPGAYTEDAPATVNDDLSEVLDDAVFGEITEPADGAVFDEDAQELTWSGALAAGESVTITYTVTYDSSTGDNILYNVACIPADDAVTPGADCADVQIPAAALEITKSSDPADGTRVVAGQTVAYTVSFTSTGEIAAAVDVLDDLSNVLDDATLDEASIVTSDPALTATLNGEQLAITGSVPAGETITVSYTVTVNAYAEQGDHSLGNVVTNPDGTCQIGGCPETEHPVRHISLTKSADPTEGVQTGDTVEYTVTVANDGEAAYTATDPAVITDDMSGVLDDATYNGDAVAVASDGSEVPAPSYLSPVLGWAGPIAVGESVTITYTVTVTNLGDHDMLNTAGSVCAEGEICDPPVDVDVDLPYITPSKTSDPASGESVSAGDVVMYTLSWTNAGLATGAVDSTDDLSNVLDDGTITSEPVVDEATAASIAAVLDLDAQTIRVTGDLAPGETTTVTYQVTIGADGDRGDNIAGNVLTPDVPPYVCEEGAAECEPFTPPTTEHPIGELVMDKSVDPESGTDVDAGQQVTYTLSFEAIGEGPSAVDALDNLSDVLDDATLVDGAIVTSNEALTATLDGNELSVTGEVPAGETYTVSYTVTVNAFADQADHVLGNVLSNADGTCGVGGCPETENPIRHFNVTKSADPTTDVRTGDTVTYTVTVTNDGEADYTTEAPAAVSDDMTDVLDDAAYNGDAAAVASDGSEVPAPEYAAPTLTWAGPLAAGESVTITYTVMVTNLGDHDLVNVASPVCAEGVLCDPPTPPVEVLLPSITPAKTSDPASGEAVNAGDVVTYTLSWTNNGLATGPVDSTDDLSNVLDDGTITSEPVVDEATADSIAAVLDLDAQTIRVTGDLAPGETTTVTYQVTIGADGERGDNIAGNVLTPDVPPYVCEQGAAACEPFTPPTTEHPIGELDDWKTADPASGVTVQAGQVITYTLSFENTGEAAVAVNRDDVLTQVLDDATVTAAPASSDAALTVSEIMDGRITVTGSLEPGQLVTVAYTVTVNADGARGDDRLGNFLVNTGEQPPAECVPVDGERADCTVNNVSNVVVSKSSDPASGTEVAQGENVTYTLTFENVSTDAAGVPIDYTDHMVDVLDDATLQAGPTSSDEAVTAVTDGDTIRITGAVASGDTVTVTYTVTVKAYDQQGNHTLGNVVAITGEEPVCAPDSPLCTIHDLPKPPPLATTGGEVTWWVLATGLILLAGGGVLMIARRRRTEENVEAQLIS